MGKDTQFPVYGSIEEGYYTKDTIDSELQTWRDCVHEPALVLL